MRTLTCHSTCPQPCQLSFLNDQGKMRQPLCDRTPVPIRDAYTAAQSGQTVKVQELLARGDWAEATHFVAHHGQCLAAKYLLAKVFLAVGQRAEAEQQLLAILEVQAHPAILCDLARFYAADARRLSEAFKYSQWAHALAPDDAWVHCRYARDLIHAGRVDEGVKHMCQAAHQAPDDPFLQTNCLWHRHYVPEQDRQGFFQAYVDWGRRFAPMYLCCYEHLNRPEPQRRLRIGYISPNFCRHSVAYTFAPILDGHDRTQVELFGYGSVACPDEITERLQTRFDHYRDIHGLHPQHMAQQIHADQIDILVALAGHCTGNCLAALAYGPAPIQVDLGSISTTGMEQIDYRITDEVLDPPDTQAFYVEELAYISGGFVSYCPPQESPLVEPLPAQAHGYVTFGSFNNHVKINDFTLGLWCQVLQAVPDSGMILKFQAAHDPGLQAFYLSRFARQGIAADRIQFRGVMSHFEHLRVLGQVDIALDCFPFNGCVTSLEGLWMGVPVLTLNGTTYVAQVGRNIMTQLGLETFVSRHPDEFVAKARSFAAQPDALASIRRSLRGLMLDSQLCRPGRLARELESAYRHMWHRWCRKGAGVSV